MSPEHIRRNLGIPDVKVKFVRFQTAEQMAMFWCENNDTDFPKLVKAFKRIGCFAFSVDRRQSPSAMRSMKRSLVYYWRGAKTPQLAVAMLLAHELGHLVGKVARRDRDEEDRAHTYSTALFGVMKHLKRVTS